MIKITPVNEKESQEGVWTTYHGVKLKIARSNNERYLKTFLNLSRPHRKAIEKNALDEETSIGIICQSMAEGILVDWEGLKTAEGEIAYSVDNAVNLLENDPDCREYVMEYASDMANYLISDKEELLEK